MRKAEVCGACSGALMVLGSLYGQYDLADEDLRYQHAESVAVIAHRKADAGETLTYDELMPEYMRLAEAEQRLRAGTLSDRIRKPVKI